MRFLCPSFITLIVVPAMGAAAHAQCDNNPPPGPITAVYKTLDQVEPRIPLSACRTPGDADSVYRISQPGSYYLTESLSVPAGFSGIEVTTADVAIDLNGFRIRGLAGSIDGVKVTVAPSVGYLSVRNGVISGLGGAGISSPALGVTGARLADLTIASCGGGGAIVGRHALVERCQFLYCTTLGLTTSANSVVHSSTVEGCASGFDLGENCRATDCVSDFSQQFGFRGLQASIFVRCIARSSVQMGFVVANNVQLIQCTARGNQWEGITGPGSAPSDGVSVIDCTLADNVGLGVEIDLGSQLRGCVINANGGGGASIGGNSLASDNSFAVNTGTGLLVTGSFARVESNTFSSNTTGLSVPGAGQNQIYRNSAMGNGTNYSVAGGNGFLVTNSIATAPAFANIQP